MSLTRYRTLGRSGLVVSPLALGTMTFGPGEWNADDATARAVFDTYRDAGGNFIDTADIYSGGGSEELVGRFIKETSARDELVLATKFGFNGSASPLSATQVGGGNPNAGGAGAKNIHRALDASLRRLGTDYVDLYWMHIWDGVTPAEELVETLGALVRAGKIRYYAFSDMPAWLAIKAADESQRSAASLVRLRCRWNTRWWHAMSRPSTSRQRGTREWAFSRGARSPAASCRASTGAATPPIRAGSAAPTRSATASSPIATGTCSTW